MRLGREPEVRGAGIERRHSVVLVIVPEPACGWADYGRRGIPRWTTDIFHGGNPDDHAFKELFTRWFQWAAFFPVKQLHGDREPKPEGQPTASGVDNEIWSYGEEVYEICKRSIGIREQLRPYTRELMKEAHEMGTPVMRTLFYEFPGDRRAWSICPDRGISCRSWRQDGGGSRRTPWL